MEGMEGSLVAGAADLSFTPDGLLWSRQVNANRVKNTNCPELTCNSLRTAPLLQALTTISLFLWPHVPRVNDGNFRHGQCHHTVSTTIVDCPTSLNPTQYFVEAAIESFPSAVSASAERHCRKRDGRNIGHFPACPLLFPDL